MNSLIQLWKNWVTGNLAPDTLLWGVKLVWWARIGKFAQFIGGVTILADIVGPERIRKFGRSLHSVISSENIFSLCNRLYQLWKLQFERFRLYSFLYANGKMPVYNGKFGIIAISYDAWLKIRGKKIDVDWALLRYKETHKELFGNPLYNKLQYGLPIVVLASNIYCFRGVGLTNLSLIWENKTLSIFIFGFATLGGCVFSWYFSSVVFFLVLIPGLLIDGIIIEPLAWILERQSLEVIIKLFALFLLIGGFHFDLLAS